MFGGAQGLHQRCGGNWRTFDIQCDGGKILWRGRYDVKERCCCVIGRAYADRRAREAMQPIQIVPGYPVEKRGEIRLAKWTVIKSVQLVRLVDEQDHAGDEYRWGLPPSRKTVLRLAVPAAVRFFSPGLAIKACHGASICSTNAAAPSG